MELWIILMLFGAGFLGGLANAIAGGATLITFPAMLASGLPPVIANASNALAVLPGALMAAWANRGKLPGWSNGFALLLVSALLGGAFGGVLLMLTSDRLFSLLVPALIGFATLIFAFGKRIQGMVRGLADGSEAAHRPDLPGRYGGYFGAGLGVMLMAVLAITGHEELRQANAIKNVAYQVANLTAVVVFVVMGLIAWPQTLVMLVGAACGGFSGGKLMAVLPAQAVRSTIIVIGCAMTLIYAWRAWF